MAAITSQLTRQSSDDDGGGGGGGSGSGTNFINARCVHLWHSWTNSESNSNSSAYPMRSYLSVLNKRQMLGVSLIFHSHSVFYLFAGAASLHIPHVDDARHDKHFFLSLVFALCRKKRCWTRAFCWKTFNFHISHFYIHFLFASRPFFRDCVRVCKQEA